MGRGGGAGAVAAMALTCVFGVTLFLSMAAGAGVYRRVEERIERSAEERIGLTYITAKLHSADQAGGIQTGTFGGGDAVYLLEELDGVPCETILYVYDGALRELFCERAWEPGPEAGQAVTAARELAVTEAAPGLLRLRYTAGDGHVSQADVWTRTGGTMENTETVNDGETVQDGDSVTDGETIQDGDNVTDGEPIPDAESVADGEPIPDAESVNESETIQDSENVEGGGAV